MKRYDPEAVKEVVTEIAKAAGVPEQDAETLADSLVDADISGLSTHGVSRVNIYMRRIQKGLIDPKAKISFDKKGRSVIAVDAGNGLGQVQASKVLEELISMAKTGGIAAATIRNSQHFGALSYYCNRAAQENMILIAMTTAEPSMSPEGGCAAYFGTNPIAASFPTGKAFNFVRIDLSTSLVARGNIIAAQKEGKAIPSGWALDVEGNPTTDPDEALMGTVLTMAGHKGYALALLVELFSSVLSGAAIGSSIGSMYKDMDRKQDVGHFFCLMDISAFMDVSHFKKRVDSMIDEIKACKRRPNVEEILIPGERKFRVALEKREHGIPIGEQTFRELEVLCEEYKIPFKLKERRME
ncbi:MAG: Ldh family oxidoreductase [Deltaproteobacteria bacterium]|nr:MAG: Ldh family oxidoreductase [Deltaproteobacteria bacterium]